MAVRGPEYDFTATNGWIAADKWYSTSEKDIIYDEDGNNPEVVLDQDPHKTIVEYNEHNYVTASDFFDNLTETYVNFNFDYVNCGGEAKDDSQAMPDFKQINIFKVSPLQFLKPGSQWPIKDKMKVLRKAIPLR